MKKIVILIVFVYVGCLHSTVRSIKELEKREFDNNQEILIARRALRMLEKDSIDSLKLMFSKSVLLKTSHSVWSKVVSDAHIITSTWGAQPDSLLQVSNSVIYKGGNEKNFAKLSFPYVSEVERGDSLVYINIVVSDNELYGLFVAEYPFGIHLLR